MSPILLVRLLILLVLVYPSHLTLRHWPCELATQHLALPGYRRYPYRHFRRAVLPLPESLWNTAVHVP